MCFTIFHLHLHRFSFLWKAVTHCNSCTNYRGQNMDLVIHCACVTYFAATVLSYFILVSFLAVPEETSSNILECLSERRQCRHDEALTSMYRDLTCIARVRLDFVIRVVQSTTLRSGPNIQKIRLTSLTFLGDGTLCFGAWKIPSDKTDGI